MLFFRCLWNRSITNKCFVPGNSDKARLLWESLSPKKSFSCGPGKLFFYFIILAYFNQSSWKQKLFYLLSFLYFWVHALYCFLSISINYVRTFIRKMKKKWKTNKLHINFSCVNRSKNKKMQLEVCVCSAHTSSEERKFYRRGKKI